MHNMKVLESGPGFRKISKSGLGGFNMGEMGGRYLLRTAATDNNFNIYPNPEQRNPDHVGSIKKTWNHPELDPA